MPLSAFTEYTQKHYRKALFEKGPIGTVTNPVEGNPLRPGHTLRTIVGGKARGALTGGCLTLLATTMGTVCSAVAFGTWKIHLGTSESTVEPGPSFLSQEPNDESTR